MLETITSVGIGLAVIVLMVLIIIIIEKIKDFLFVAMLWSIVIVFVLGIAWKIGSFVKEGYYHVQNNQPTPQEYIDVTGSR